MEGDAAVEGGLASEGEEYAVRFFPGYDFLDEEWGDREEVDLVGYAFTGLDRCDVRVDQDGLYPLFPEGLERLGAGVVEFAGFAYLEGAGPEEENFVYIVVYHCVVYD